MTYKRHRDFVSKLTCRDGTEVQLTLYNELGNKKEITDADELDFIPAFFLLKRMHGSIARRSLRTHDFYYIRKLLTITLKESLLHKSARKERDEATSRILAGFQPKYIECVFRNRKLKFKCNSVMDLQIFNELLVRNQYDVNESNVKNKVIVDAGASTGMFSVMCAVLGAKKVYAFEPVKSTFQELEDNIRGNGFEKVIVPVGKAVGDKNFATLISYSEDGNTGASICLIKNQQMTQEIDVVRLDDFLKGEKVDLVKMDVEGYEENVLLGMKELIKKFKPVLTFSAYHKSTDKKRLPEVVRSMREDYRIVLNIFGEEDFYCD